jgi:hypothetical protein
MNKTFRNFWLDAFLFVLLSLNLIAVIVMPPLVEGVHPGVAWHVHAITGILMAFGCLVHIGLHWPWFQAVLTGKAKGRIKLVMNSMVAVTLLLAGLSGDAALGSAAAGSFHSLTGSIALLGLFIHGVKHMRWMASTGKRLTTGDRQETVAGLAGRLCRLAEGRELK